MKRSKNTRQLYLNGKPIPRRKYSRLGNAINAGISFCLWKAYPGDCLEAVALSTGRVSWMARRHTLHSIRVEELK